MFTRRYTNFWDGLFRPSKTHLLGSSEVKTLTNLITNGNFVDATGWTPTQGTGSVEDNTYTLTSNGTAAYAYVGATTTEAVVGHTYGITFRLQVTNGDCVKIQWRYGLGSYSPSEILTPIANEWYQKTYVFTANSTYANLLLLHRYIDAAAANGKVMEVQYVSCVDLTAAFGAGNEPTLTDYTNWIATQSNSWFSTTAQYLCNTNQWF